MSYENHKNVLNDVIVTNHKPVIEFIQDIEVKAGETVELNVSVSDIDGDELTIIISDPVGNDGVWETEQEDVGQHAITINASDSYSNSIKIVNIIVTNENSVPVLNQVSDMEINEGETVSVVLSASDADGDELNYDVYDDNFDEVIEGWFEWTTTYDDAGVYDVFYGVTDGTELVQDSFIVTVLDVINECEGVVCESYCDNFSSYYNGACFEGECAYAVKENAVECGWVQEGCSSDDDCPGDTYGDNSCSANMIVKDHFTYSCVNPGTANSECVETVAEEAVSECEICCDSGMCVDHYTLNEFDEYGEEAPLTFEEGGEQIVYVTLPKDAVIISSYVKVTGGEE